MPSIKTNAAYNVAYQVVRLVFPLVTYPYVTRIIGPSGVGRVSFAQTVADYFCLISMLGIPTYGVRALSQARSAIEESNKVFSELLIISSFLSLLAFAVYASLPVLVPALTPDMVLFWIFGMTILVNGAGLDWFFQAHENYRYITVRNLMVRTISAALIFIIIRVPSHYVRYGSLWVAGTIAANLLNLSYSFRQSRFDLRGVRFAYHLKKIIPTAGLVFASTLYGSIDTIMLGTLIADEQVSVGLYSIAGRLMRIALSIVAAMTAVAIPRVARKHAEGDVASVERLIQKNLLFVLFFAIPSVIGLVLFADDIVMIFAGPSFAGAIRTTKILASELVFLAITGIIANQALYARGRERTALSVALGGLILAISFNLLLIPTYHQNGAAVATLITRSIECFVLCAIGWRLVSGVLFSADMLKIVFLNALLALLVVLFRMISREWDPGVRMLLSLCVIGSAYLSIAFAIKTGPAREMVDWAFSRRR